MERNAVVEMVDDIRKMLILISAFTDEDTEGSALLEEWQAKYGQSENNDKGD